MSGKHKHCTKVKNACKYCLEQVTNRNGLQCQGACKKWAHYKCLSYTPGKISDIKAGIIKVMCPCPDCETTQVKEFLTNPPFSCSNQKCPANIKGPVNCDSIECPSNIIKKNDSMMCSNRTCPNFAVPHSQKKPPRSGSPRTRICLSPVPKVTKQSKKQAKGARITASDSSCSDQNAKKKNSNTSIDNGDPKHQAAMVHALKEMGGTVAKLSVQIKELMYKINKLA